MNKQHLFHGITIILYVWYISDVTATDCGLGRKLTQCTGLTKIAPASKKINNRRKRSSSPMRSQSFNETSSTETCKCLEGPSHHQAYYDCENQNGECVESKVYILKGRWWDESDSQKTYACPFGYCNLGEGRCIGRNDSESYCLFDKTSQCSKGREGRLCGKCAQNLSVAFGSEDCKQCKDTNILILLIFFAILSILILAIIYFNVNAFSGYFNAFLYSYQVMGVFIPKYVELDLDRVSLFFIYALGLQGTGSNLGVCFYDGMDNLDKIGLNFVIPAYMIVFTAIIGRFLPNRAWQFLLTHQTEGSAPRRVSIGRAFSFVAVICYSLITTITLDLIDRITIDGKEYVYKAAFVEYLGTPKHEVLFAMAIISLILFVLGFPALLFGSFWFARIFRDWIQMHRLEPVLNSLKNCFKPKMTWFASFYFLCRLTILLFTVFINADIVRAFCLAMSCGLFLFIFAVCQPYKRWRFNFWDLVQMTNMLFISITGLLLQHQSSMRRKIRDRLIVLLRVLIYVPLVIAFSRTIFFYTLTRINRSPWCRMRILNRVELRYASVIGHSPNNNGRAGHPPTPQRVMDSFERSSYQNSQASIASSGL